jgi:hypothetical protein
MLGNIEKRKLHMKEKKKTKIKKPKTYQKPEVFSEKLLAFAASCNGSTNGGRKSTVSGPVHFCRSNRLNS